MDATGDGVYFVCHTPSILRVCAHAADLRRFIPSSSTPVSSTNVSSNPVLSTVISSTQRFYFYLQ